MKHLITIDKNGIIIGRTFVSEECYTPTAYPSSSYIEIEEKDFDSSMVGAAFLNKQDNGEINYIPCPGPGFEFAEGKWIDVASVEDKFVSIKMRRSALLAASDWTQTLDCPLSEEKRNEWKVWRQALRDLPVNFPIPEDAQRELDRLSENRP